MAALFLTALLGFAALAIDVSNLFVVRNELQNAADAAALAGAPCLYARTECMNLTSTAPDWSTAQQKAINFIPKNRSANLMLTDGLVEYGYWNVTSSSAGLQQFPLKPGPNDLPAVKVTISKESSKNGGTVQVFLARIFGINSVPVAAAAVAVVSRPGYAGPGSLFPVAITQCMYDNFWDPGSGKPKTAATANPPGFDLPQTVGQPYVFKITSSYHTGPCEAGQWTSLDIDNNNVPAIRNIIDNGNQSGIGIGDSIWIQPGTKTTLYASVNNCSASGDKSCEYVMAPVVAKVDTHAYNPVLAFACLHVILAKGASEKYIQLEMSADPDHCQATNSGGIGPAYGALMPPRLVY